MMTIDWHSTNNNRFIKNNIILSNVKGMNYDKPSKQWNSDFAYGTKHSNIGIEIEILWFITNRTRNKRSQSISTEGHLEL